MSDPDHNNLEVEQQQSSEPTNYDQVENQPTEEGADDDLVDKELEAMQARVKEMEAEAAKLRDMQRDTENSAAPAEDSEEVDKRSIHIGNVDFGSTPEELQSHFQACGTINRVTILCDKFTGHPKGFAYVEFAEPKSVQEAIALNESLFRGRLLKVTAKRTNIPGFAFRGRGRGRARGAPYYTPYYRGSRGRGRGRGSFYPRGGYHAPY